MQRGQYQVASQRSLDGNLSRLKIPDFADHDHVWVLPQDSAQGLGKVQINFGVDLGLANARQFVLNRVFHRHDVAGTGVQPLKRCIQRCGFSGAGRSGNQNDTVRLRDQVFKAAQHLALHAHRLKAQFAFAFVQQTQHGALAVGAGQDADAHIDCTGTDAQTDAAVLRQAFFRNVEIGHDLQARYQCGVQCPVRLHHLAQRAVYPKTHAGMALVRLDMDIAGAIARGLREQRVEHADDRCIVRGFKEVFYRRQVLHHAGQVGVGFDLADHRRRTRLAVSIGSTDALRQRAQVGALQVHYRALRTIFTHHFTQGSQVRAGVVPQQQAVTIVLEQQGIAARKSVGQGVAHGALFQRRQERRWHGWCSDFWPHG